VERITLTIPDGDQTLEVAAFALGSGPLALCLHGYPDSAWTWRHLMPELADLGYRAVAPFNRGYAPTSLAPTGRYQSGVLGVDANHIHDALDGDQDAVIIGHDWGAMATYAATGLEPGRWRRAVAAAAPPGPVTGTGFFTFDQLRLSWYVFFQLTDLAEGVIPLDDYDYIRRLWAIWSPGYDSSEDVDKFVASMPTAEHLAAALGTYRQTMDFARADPALKDAQAAAFGIPTMPLLYLHGELDGSFSPALGATVGEYLTVPGSRAVMVPDAGHFLHLEKPGQFNEEILAFLAQR
jgi:pimeloyl-ACP methyl ester carboxylesterase